MIVIDMAGSTVLVTGAGGGIGVGIVRRFLDAGARVVAQVRAPSEVLRNLREEHDRLRIIVGELKDDEFVVDLFDPSAPYGPLDVVINNAGIYPSSPIMQTSSVDFEQVLRSNAGITFACLREAARSMSVGEGGSIVNIGSLNVARPNIGQAAYSGAKAAIANLTRSAAAELAPYKIRVNTVSPGLIDRAGLNAAWPEGVSSWIERCPSGRLGRADDVADACLFLASPLASWITGHELVVDGGMSAAPSY